MRLNLDVIGYCAACLTTLAFVPQAIKTIRSRETHGISAWMYATFAAGVALWCLYGVVLSSWPIILANALTFLLAVVILALKIRFG